eukprot:7491231-Prorocentrum_lima.AAC.1
MMPLHHSGMSTNALFVVCSACKCQSYAAKDLPFQTEVVLRLALIPVLRVIQLRASHVARCR